MATDENSKRVLDLCDQAFALPSAEREVFLAGVCGDDARLRASVDSVLIAVGQAGMFLETDSNSQQSSKNLTGRHVGSYEIGECLGEGGMGSVYLADRREEGFEQRVAIKFVHGHMLAKELIERFKAERKILAGLNHPYIAALIDSGSTDDGLPYIVMEYVDGMPIDDYCNEKKLGIVDRIRLIQKVATAVQAAHQNLVVHRDLKPSNVLITPDGIPKLLDFGIAKLMQPADSTSHGNTTIFGRQAMTPDYASPEQILENKVTTASDVYSMGVLTYQLLVGERPYHIQAASHRDMVKSVESLAVPKPSTRLDTIASADLRKQIALQRATTVDRLQKTLRGDIDNILLMALRQEPERRYPSVDQFAEDLGRYLHGLPVSAHADTFGYRASKFLQRNWLPVAATVVVMLTLVGGVIAYAIQAQEAALQRNIAQTQALNAQNTVNFLKDVLFVGDPFAGEENEQTIADVLEYAEKNLEESYSGEPASKALILAALGDIYAARADYDRSIGLSSAAIELYEGSLGTDSNDAANAYRIKGQALSLSGRYEDAETVLQTAIAIYQKLPNPDWAGLVQSLDQMGAVKGYIADDNSGIDFHELAISTYRNHEVDDPALLITILGNLATENLQRGNYAAAEPMYVEAIEIARNTRASDGHIGTLLSNYAGVLQNLGQSDEATDKYNEAAELLIGSVGLEYPETITVLTSLAAHYRDTGNLDKAGQTIRKAIDAANRGLPKVHFITSYVQNVGGGIFCLGEDVPYGTALAMTSLESRRELLPPGHWAISSGEAVLGTCHTAAGDFEVAEVTLLNAYANIRETLGDGHEVTRATVERLQQLYTAWGKPEKAALYTATTK